MRAAEKVYWDNVAKVKRDNVWKRAELARRLLNYSWAGERILEIGVGLGTTAGAIKTTFLGNFDYIGTDVSEIFCKMAVNRFGLKMVNTDILKLPKTDGGFTRILALDTLEHVNPDDREEGYRSIGDRLADKALMFINIPLSPSLHEKEFDHAFDFSDIDCICRLADLRLKLYEEYRIDYPHGGHSCYGWTVLERGAF